MFPKKKWNWRRKTSGIDSRRKGIEKLDNIFSQFIRIRDSDALGICKCITCHRIDHWKRMDAGHFISRDRLATRFDERNVNAQCPACNRFNSGRQYKHGTEIDRKYGEGTAELLQSLGEVRGTKINTLWIEIKIMEYRKKVKTLLTRRV